ncbi:MAG TPA: hypothetical protein VHL59_11525 [Thermoanaerobaculia bacterium]|nr:hypothetical protein [Thermoanaerobaculia bacterium]
MKRVFVSLIVSMLLFAVAPQAEACLSLEPAFNLDYEAEPNARLNDYARIHVDSENPACAQAAMFQLTEKVRRQLAAGGFDEWLDGYSVALIFAAAMRMGALGWASRALDDVLIGPVSVATRFTHMPQSDPVCGKGTPAFNTCMDDYTGTAAGYAWMAAYKERRTRGSGGGFRGNAIDFVNQAMDSVCIWSPHTEPIESGVPLCNRDVTHLRAGQAETLSPNQGQQQIAYGFGLMTSIASAHIGINLAGSGYNLSDDQKAIATGLFAEAQKHITAAPHAPGTIQVAFFDHDCLSNQTENGRYRTDDDCDGSADYRPNMYALRAFYDHPNVRIPVPGRVGLDPLQPDTLDYDSNSFDPNEFPGTDSDGFFGWGRFVTYGFHGYGWWLGQPDFMPYDDHDPDGWFEGISSTGLAQGWACDKDTTMLRQSHENGDVRGIWIDFYVDGDPFTAVAQGFADSASEDEINTRECGRNGLTNGTAHRFWIQLPPGTKNKIIRAFALDYTWYGHTELGGGPHTW